MPPAADSMVVVEPSASVSEASVARSPMSGPVAMSVRQPSAGADVGVGTGVGVLVGCGVGVGVFVGRGVGVSVGCGLGVGVFVGRGVGVSMGRGAGVGGGLASVPSIVPWRPPNRSGVAVGAGVGVLVGAGMGVSVGAGADVFVGTGAGVSVGTRAGAGVGVLVEIGAGVSVGTGPGVGVALSQAASASISSAAAAARRRRPYLGAVSITYMLSASRRDGIPEGDELRADDEAVVVLKAREDSNLINAHLSAVACRGPYVHRPRVPQLFIAIAQPA